MLHAPVDDALPAIHEAFVIKFYECLLCFCDNIRIKSEFLAAPVARGTKLAELALHNLFVFQGEGEHLLIKFIARDFETAASFLFKFLVKHHLRLKTRMIRAREPERLESPHALVARHDVLECYKNRVSDVKRAVGIGRRHDDGKGFFSCRKVVGVKKARSLPCLIDAVFTILRLVLRRDFVWLHNGK